MSILKQGGSLAVEVLRALIRRWYVVLLGLALTAGMVYGAAEVSPPKYQARALVLLLPAQSDFADGGNPLLNLSGLEQPASILAAYFASAPAQAEVAAFDPDAEYLVAIEPSTRGPIISVDVTAQSPDETMSTLEHLLSRIPEELARLQQEVAAPANATIGSMQLAVDQKPTADRSTTLRLMVAALVIGLVGTALTAYSVDSLVQRRRARRHGDSSDDEDDATGPEDDSEVQSTRIVPRGRSRRSRRASGDEQADEPIVRSKRPVREESPRVGPRR